MQRTKTKWTHMKDIHGHRDCRPHHSLPLPTIWESGWDHGCNESGLDGSKLVALWTSGVLRLNLYFQISTSIRLWSCLVFSIGERACTRMQKWWRSWKLSSFVDDLIVGGDFHHRPPIQGSTKSKAREETTREKLQARLKLRRAWIYGETSE